MKTEGGSAEFYDRLASAYQDYSRTREPYLLAVERLIAASVSPGASVLDVGAGDGRRSRRLSEAIGARSLTLMDNSARMLELSTKSAGTDAHIHADISQAPPKVAEFFDVVVCLWNVLGHLPDADARRRALANMTSVLTPRGRIFTDVNNRYNVRAYGVGTVLRNVLKDVVAPAPTNGDVVVSIAVGGTSVESRGHVFSPSEAAGLVRAAGLEVVRRTVVDYATGAVRRSVLSGQLLFELRRGGPGGGTPS